ncbi:MAG: hypothetical protein R3233_01545 [Xanthomonadales bacterium]|nr:hypothetical protein [Xanthomonadales bacterium]
MGSKPAFRKREPRPSGWPAAPLRALLAAASIGLYSGPMLGQEPEAAAAPAAEFATAVLAEIPQPRHLAAALADPDSRADSLLTVIAVARLLDYASQADLQRAAELETRFREERGWLDRLAARYTPLPSRPSLFDPAAWYLLLELGQQGLSPGMLTSPLGPDSTSLLRQVFDRNDERIAAALLPELLPYMERDSTALWRYLREQLPGDPALTAVVSALNADWFDPWAAAEPPAPAASEAQTDLIAASVENLRAVVSAAMTIGPPDTLRMKRLRFELLQALPELPGPAAADAAYLLALTSAVEGLYRREYLAFTGTLLWVATDLLLAEPAPDAEWRSPLPRLLTELLPGLSNAYAGDFSEVDPRINASLAAVFDVTQYLQSASPAPDRRAALRQEVADAVAQLVLLIPDMGYYFEQPVRQRIAEEVDICLSIMAGRDQRGGADMSRQQFDGCLESLVGMANELASRAELAGDPDGPFGTEQLRREMLLTPWQRINYTLGYLHDRHPSGCERPDQPLPNPLEWSSLATVVVWFARQAPVYVQTPENEARLAALRRSGDELIETWVRQVDCISGAGTGLNDPVVRGLGDYRRALDDLVAGVREAELEFRESRLKPGSDVMLHSDANQRTAFRNEELAIGPCDASRVCEMSGRLDATRALIGLFPDPYLIADQTGLGEIEICYDNLQWVDRRSEPVRADDPFVANYYGRLSFDLVGRYHEGGETTEVFGFNFVSPGEYHYLFAAATEEVLGDSCPVEWIGSRIVTGLGDDERVRIVPDRLTYLAAARSLPSQVIAANWGRNEEWRDSFVTGRGVTPHAYEPGRGIVDRVNRHLRALYQEEQSMLYNALLRPGAAGGFLQEDSLYERLEELTVYKSLLRSYMVLFYPQFMLDASDVRAALEGHGSLLSRRILQGFREANVAVSSINEAGLERLDRLQALWSRQPEVIRRSGSTAVSVAHAMARLDALHDEFFVQPRRAATPAAIITTPAPVTVSAGD